MEEPVKQEKEFVEALLQVDRVGAAGVFEEVYSREGTFAALESLAVGALETIGEGWEKGTFSLSQVYMSGVISEELMDSYLPGLDQERKNSPRLAIGVLLDYHSLGKRIVYSVLRASGYEVLDLGPGLSPGEMVQKTLDNNIDVLLISTLMLSSALKVEDITRELQQEGSAAKVIVGGAPFRLDPGLWKKVGAAATGSNASSIVSILRNTVEGGADR